MSANMDILFRNNTGNQGKERLVDGFVVRLKVFSNIFNEIKLSVSDKPEQNYLIIGQRGAGKTTLLYRLKYAIEDDTDLNKNVIPIIFNEEQYHLADLFSLWETVAEGLEEFNGFEGAYQQITALFSGSPFDEERAYELIEHLLKTNQKKVILFIENIDVLFKKIGKEGQQRLREVLSTSNVIRIIGAATTHFEGIINYSDPFYDFFKITTLSGLSKIETLKLLTKIAEQSNELDKAQPLLRRGATRIESIRRLTGGNPRMMSYLYAIFLDNANGKAIKDLYSLLDDLTFLYKAELDQLSTQQQRVVDVIAKNWDAISVKELTMLTRMESKYISSVILALEKNQVIERVPTQTKNNLYRLKDRFMNIWYLMRFGRKKEKENILWLVRFYDVWCDKNELTERVLHHINNLLDGNYDKVAAIDMVSTFLSLKNLSGIEKYKLLQTTRSTLPFELIRHLKLSENDLFETIKDLVKKKKFDDARTALDEMESRGALYHQFAYWININEENFDQAAINLESIYKERGDALTAFTLADLLETRLSKPDDAVTYFLAALKGNKHNAAFRLGQIYFFVKSNVDLAIKYYKIAIDHGDKEAIMALATVYFTEKNYTHAKELCYLAIEKGDYTAYQNLSVLLRVENDIPGAINMLEKAIEHKEYDALLSLAELYQIYKKGNARKIRSAYSKAIDRNVPEAYYAYGKYLLRNERKSEEAVSVLRLGVLHEDVDATHLLAHYYQETKAYAEAEKLFIKSFEMGKRTSLICLSNTAYDDHLEDRKEFILNLFEERMAPIQEPLIAIEYGKLLIWNDRSQEALALLKENEAEIAGDLEMVGEDYKEDFIAGMTSFIIRLLKKKQYKLVKELFKSDLIDYKQILKPVYFAYMRFVKDEYPNDYLKAGSELEETIKEIIEKVEDIKIKKHH
jgi:TPR repeat protein/energy-coupling factor transporter ATP-binding protein EcfA2